MEADLANINKAEITKVKIANLLNILYKVTEKKLQKIINKLSKDRVLGPDNITNKVIYIVAPLILKKLAQIIIKYLVTGLPKELKKLFTLILRKKEEKKYSLLGAYRFIALKNTLVKLTKKVLTIYIIRKAEAEILSIKLNKRKKRPLYSLSNTPPYINSSDDIESQTRVYNINT